MASAPATSSKRPTPRAADNGIVSELTVVQSRVPLRDTLHDHTLRPATTEWPTSARPSPSKSATTSPSTEGVSAELRSVRHVCPPPGTIFQAPASTPNTSVLPSPSKSPNRRSLTRWIARA
jgi:hypothetical protein